jgi:hypothetical protein
MLIAKLSKTYAGKDTYAVEADDKLRWLIARHRRMIEFVFTHLDSKMQRRIIRRDEDPIRTCEVPWENRSGTEPADSVPGKIIKIKAVRKNAL